MTNLKSLSHLRPDPRHGQRGDQDSDKQGDNGDNDKHLNQCKGGAVPVICGDSGLDDHDNLPAARRNLNQSLPLRRVTSASVSESLQGTHGRGGGAVDWRTTSLPSRTSAIVLRDGSPIRFMSSRAAR